ncbi:MAG: pilus assembly protein PilX [Clostridiales Family XIII bacterium]|nr:pilus assembly protein PilX [Clostridiales Family XIII bacterium]
MRKLNSIISVLIVVIFILHGLMGSFMLVGVGSGAGKVMAWFGMALVCVHTVIGAIFTVRTIRAGGKGGKAYMRQNRLFWARRASGLAILLLAFCHIGLFGSVVDGQYILFEFTTVRLITQLLLIAALFAHIFVNIRPLLVSLGIVAFKERRVDIFLVLSVLLLFFAGATVFYYIGWQYL